MIPWCKRRRLITKRGHEKIVHSLRERTWHIIETGNDKILNGTADVEVIEGLDGNDSITGGGVVSVRFPQGATVRWGRNQSSRLDQPEVEGH
jgi:hypothetical protein